MREKILLVDDVRMFLELQKDFLQGSDFRIFAAQNGEEALRICKEERPALVFMDLHMPIMNGAESCMAIKKERLLAATRVVLVTSEGNSADRDICRAAGCDGFLTKPLDRNAFLDVARKLLPSVDRREKRVSCRLNAKFRVFGLTLSGSVLDISRGGLYLSTTHEIQKDTLLEMVFSLPGDGAIVQARGKVAWINTARNRQKPALPEGVGIEFLQLSNSTGSAVERFVTTESF